MPNFNQPLVSIITVVFNNDEYIRDAIESVLSQDYSRIEHIVIDGCSTDGTIDIIKEYSDNISVFLSEPDEGIFDALNKGVVRSHGEIIGILHSDDLFCDKYVISDVINKMKDTEAELCFSDLVIVDAVSGKLIRYYMAHYFRRWMLRIGWLPPHPTVFLKRSIFDEFGLYSKNYQIAGDFEFFVRIFYGRQIKWSYLNRISVMMRRGGASNSGLKSIKLAISEINRSLSSNHVWSTSIFQLARYFIRFLELIVQPKKNSCNSLNKIKTPLHTVSFMGYTIKRFFDLLLCSLSLVIFSFVMFTIAITIKLTSKGQILYWSDRVGKDNRIFEMPKFRTMHINTPVMATHEMKNPNEFLTPIGGFLRKNSLDELPQLFSILKGDMSFVGPRPALFNQDDLIALRTENGVNMLVPGLTGWAQVNGRDELPIREKVAWDVGYMEGQSFLFDMKILWLTCLQVIKRDGVSH